MNVKLKICGMRNPVNIAEVAALQPDYMGFIFYERSPRYTGNNFVIPEVTHSIMKVGVFVNEPTDKIVELVNSNTLDFVQLHGDESKEQCEILKDKGIEVIKVFSVDDNFDFASVIPFKEYVKYFLFDTKGSYFGGNARAFNWALLNQYDQSVPFFLSGGIAIENVSKLNEIRNMNIHALDINSGAELSPGLKSVDKIMEFKRVLSEL